MTKARQNKKVLEKASLECIADYIKDNKGRLECDHSETYN
jgi:hypothetical protein